MGLSLDVSQVCQGAIASLPAPARQSMDSTRFLRPPAVLYSFDLP